MLIPLQQLIQKYNLDIKVCIHVGAHWGEEYEAYKECGIEQIIFIEPCQDAFNVLRAKFSKNEDVVLLPFACGNVNDAMPINVERTNQGQSNSLLQPFLHLSQHPNVIFAGEQEIVQVRRLDDLIFFSTIKPLMMLMMDAQGFEGEILKGATHLLKQIDVIYTEINTDYTYENNMLVEEMDELLNEFERVETYMPSPSWTWGDSVYISKKILKRGT